MPSHATKPAYTPWNGVAVFAAMLATALSSATVCSAQMQMQSQAQSRIMSQAQPQNQPQADQPQDAPEPAPEPPHNPSIRDLVRHNNANTPQPSTLPPTQPTSMPPANTLPSPIAATSMPESNTASRPHHAKVTFNGGLINVRADNSSLNQILRSISNATGLKITGGVADQRVFGNYGPASTSEILATLLDGTGTNILLTEGDANTPPTLTLTPRNGGVTPPSPSASAGEEEVAYTPEPQAPPPQAPLPQSAPAPPMGFAGQAQAPVAPSASVQTTPANPLPEVSGPQPIPPPQNNVLGSDQNVTPTASEIPTTNSVPTDALPTPSTTTSGTGGQGIVDTPNPPAANSTTGSAPSTPDSIYQQLLQMQQKKQGPPATAPTPAPSPQ